MKITDYQAINYQVNTPLKAETDVRYKEDPEKLMAVCKEFEAVFINIMLKQMRSTVVEGGLTEKSHARKIFEEMQDEKMSQELAKGQGIGLAQYLYKQMQRQIIIKESETTVVE